jgi:hypothetical protein
MLPLVGPIDATRTQFRLFSGSTIFVFEVVQREFSAQSAENCHENIRFHEKRNALSSALKALSGKAFSFRGGRA